MLVTGESGIGKELLARLIHHFGPAPNGPFIAVNCGTLPRDIADSELFGHERGAFTGASARKVGWFEEADGGTLVLDEIGELPPDLQPSCCGCSRPGACAVWAETVRSACACGWSRSRCAICRARSSAGGFRADLFHRLAGSELTLPPLRQRHSDIAVLVARFLDELAEEIGPRTIEPLALACLSAHDWPGNVRQLRNVVRRAAINCPDGIVAEALNLPSRSTFPAATTTMPAMTTRLADGDGPSPPSFDYASNPSGAGGSASNSGAASAKGSSTCGGGRGG